MPLPWGPDRMQVISDTIEAVAALAELRDLAHKVGASFMERQITRRIIRRNIRHVGFGTSSVDTYMPNNTASVTATPVAVGAVDVAVTIANSPNPVSPGQNYTYTINAINNGPPTASTIVVSVPLPAGVNFQSMCDVCTRTLQRGGYQVTASSDPRVAERMLRDDQHFDDGDHYSEQHLDDIQPGRRPHRRRCGHRQDRLA